MTVRTSNVTTTGCATTAEAGGHQGLWLDGAAAQGVACGVPVTPVVTGNVNPAAFDDLIRLCAQLDKLLHAPGEHQLGQEQSGEEDAADADPDAGSVLPQQALVQAIIGNTVIFLPHSIRSTDVQRLRDKTKYEIRAWPPSLCGTVARRSDCAAGGWELP